MNTNKHTRRRFTTGETITFKHSVRLVPSVRYLVLCAKDFCWLDTKLTSHNDTVLYITRSLSFSLSLSVCLYHTHTCRHTRNAQSVICKRQQDVSKSGDDQSQNDYLLLLGLSAKTLSTAKNITHSKSQVSYDSPNSSLNDLFLLSSLCVLHKIY